MTDRLVEDFGGFLASARGFLGGVKQGASDALGKTIFAPKEKPVADLPSDVYSAEILKSSIIATANKIGNILMALPQQDQSAAKSSISEVTTFLKDSYGKIESIIVDSKKVIVARNQGKPTPEGAMLDKTRTATLNEISSRLEQINRPDGVIYKWKNEFLGKHNEKLVSASYLDKGLALIAKAESLRLEIENVKKYKQNIKDIEAEEVIKRSIEAGKEAIQGEDGDNRPYKPADVKVFSKEDEDTETVQAYRERLKNLGIESSGSGKYSTSDDEATKKAMTYLATVTGKVYGTDDEAFKDFQRDLGMFDANRDKIKELIK
jgi:hypothetical protein